MKQTVREVLREALSYTELMTLEKRADTIFHALALAGFVIVPREPTEAMSHAGRLGWGEAGCYTAMISAAEKGDG